MTYKIMTFNMRNANGADGVNAFPFRAPRIQAMLRAEAPDIIGFQEVLDDSRDWFRELLSPTYTFVGCGRDRDCREEGVPVAFRNDRFEMVALDSFWLSPTPHIPGSVYTNSDQSIFPRMAVALLLKLREQDGMLTVINTHLDHLGKNVRAQELTQLERYMRANVHGSGVLTGDLNAEPTDSELIDFAENMKALGWFDATTALPSTFHGYRLEPAVKIDYIFTNCQWRGSRLVNDVPQDGVYYSDHEAVCTLIEL